MDNKTARILGTLETMLLLAQNGQETESLVTDGLRFHMVRIVTGLNPQAQEIRAWDCAVIDETDPLTGLYPWRNALARKHDASPELAVESVLVVMRERLLHPDHPGPNCVCGPCESRWIH